MGATFWYMENEKVFMLTKERYNAPVTEEIEITTGQILCISNEDPTEDPI